MTFVFRIVLIVGSLLTLISIVKKIRNSKMQIENSIFWIVFSALLLLLSLVPQIAELITDLLGIYSTVNCIFLIVIFILLLHQFMQSVRISQLENKIKALTQEIAVRELRKKDLEKQNEESRNI